MKLVHNKQDWTSLGYQAHPHVLRVHMDAHAYIQEHSERKTEEREGPSS